MAFSINEVKLIGNLGRDVEIKNLANGVVAILNLATTESWKDKTSGDFKNETEWHRVVFYGAPATALANLDLKKGESLYVSGRIKSRKWDDAGVEKTVYEIIGETFVPHRQRQQQQQPQPQYQQQRASQPQPRTQPQQQQYQQQPQQQQQQQQQPQNSQGYVYPF